MERTGSCSSGARPTPIGIPAGAPGLELQRDETQMGLRAAPAASITLAGITARSDITATDGAKPLVLLRAGTAAIARGIARRAYEMALEYAQARHQGGVAIVEHDAVSDMLAAMAVRLAVRSRPLPGDASARRQDRADRRRGRDDHGRRAGVRRHRLHT